ncbi:MAG: hypothetical protein JO079_13830 [Frankiaceae bacterium]|nr:hypothetical protein [Frankiaceae bacterium]
MEIDAGSYSVALEHEEFLARVRAWGDQTAPARRRPVAVPRPSLLRRLAIAVATCACAAVVAALATPLDVRSGGWSLGFGSFAAGVAAGTIALRLGARRPSLAAAVSAALCFAAMFVALLLATVRV